MRNERGAITIHVAIALIPILCFLGMVLDNGAYYVARVQAQNAADAGAMAGAISLMLNDTNATAAAAAQQIANQNAIWGQTPGLANIYVWPLPYNCPDGIPACIRVDVHRGLPGYDGAHTNTIPTFIMSIANITSQGTRATATAQVGKGNAVECVKPWAVADKWEDHSNTGSIPSGWDQEDSFQGDGPDIYTKGVTGFSAVTDVGLQLMLKGEGHDFSSGWNLEVDLNGGNGGAVYNDEIRGCPDWVPTVGLYKTGTPCNSPQNDTNPELGCLNVKTGVKNGPTQDGVHYLVSLDSTAQWDTTTNTVTGGCTTTGNCASVNPLGIGMSPRIVPLALFNPKAYWDGGYNGNNGMAQVVNLLGFFVEGMCDEVFATPPAWCGTGGDPAKTVVGRLMPYPGQAKGVSGSAGPETFLKVVRLIR